MIREETVFGPIRSRRLGNSLGINLLPEKGKICNFDCIYCECGWNKDGRGDSVLPDAGRVSRMLEKKLKELLQEGTVLDSITFSGDGEPTLNPDFPQIIDETLALRDKYFPTAKVSVLSNATRVHIPEVFEAMKKVDNPIMKLDAPTNRLASLINNPTPGYDVDRVVEALKQFDGNFVLQTIFLKSKDFDSSSPEVINPWKTIVRALSPREIMVYTIDRPTPEEGLKKFSVQQMEMLISDLIADGFNIRISG